MQSVSQYPDEYEILMAPGMVITLDNKVYLKRFIDKDSGSYTAEELQSLLTSKVVDTTVAVVEGSVKPGTISGAASTTDTRIEEIGSFENIIARRQIKKIKNPRLNIERFASQKPRSQVIGKNRTRKMTAAWKLTNNRKKYNEPDLE